MFPTLIAIGSLRAIRIMVCASIFCRMVVPILYLRWEVANAVEEGSLIMQPYRSYFVGPMTKYSELVTYTESIHMFGVRFYLVVCLALQTCLYTICE